jgi:protein-L-isoaspartate O-methyltransferase
MVEKNEIAKTGRAEYVKENLYKEDTMNNDDPISKGRATSSPF